MELIRKIFNDLDINIGLCVSGLIGAIVSVKQEEKLSVGMAFSKVLTGVALANYLSPIIVHKLDLPEQVMGGVGFILGLFGMQGIDMFKKIMLKKLNHGNRN